MTRLAALALLMVPGLAALAQDGATLGELSARHGRERAQVAHVQTRAVALHDLEALLERQARELRDYAATAPLASASAAREDAFTRDLERIALVLDRDPKAAEKLIALDADERLFALRVERACAESQAALVALLDARARTMKMALHGPGAVRLDATRARPLGVRWGDVELLVDASGAIRGVDLVGDERQNLLKDLSREVPK